MGNNNSSFPTPSNVVNAHHLREYQHYRLRQIEETYSYWLSTSFGKDLTYEEFDDVFGNIVQDSFDEFQKLNNDDLVNSQYVFTILSLFADSPIPSKLKFLFGIHSNMRSHFSCKEFASALCCILKTVNIFFRTSIPSTNEIANQATVIFNSFVERNPQITKRYNDSNISSDESSNAAQSQGVTIDLEELVLLCEDMKPVKDYVEKLNRCMKINSVVDEKVKSTRKSMYSISSSFSYSRGSSSKASKNISLDYLQRGNHPLWRVSIADFFRLKMAQVDSTVEIPRIFTSDSVFRLLEFLIVRNIDALPIIQSADDQSYTNESSDEILSSLDTSPRSNSLEKIKDEELFETRIRQLLGLGDRTNRSSFTQQFQILDFFSIMMWIADCSPSSVTRAPISPMASSNHSVSAVPGYYGGVENKISPFMVPKLVARARKVSSSNAHQQWQTMGENVALSAIGSALVKCGFFHNKPIYDIHQVLPFDQCLYGAVQLIAKGYRNIPISLYPIRHSNIADSIDQVLSIHDIITLMAENAWEFLGSLDTSPIVCCDLIRRPVCVPSTYYLGSALFIMASNNVDAALILGDDSKVCGLVTDQCLKYFWLEWKKQSNPALRSKSMEDILEGYHEGKYSVFNAPTLTASSSSSSLVSTVTSSSSSSASSSSASSSSSSISSVNLANNTSQNSHMNPSSSSISSPPISFLNFSSLMTPLTSCEDMGIKLVNLKKLMASVDSMSFINTKSGSNNHPISLKEHDNDDGDNEGSSDSDDSSDSDSSSSSEPPPPKNRRLTVKTLVGKPSESPRKPSSSAVPTPRSKGSISVSLDDGSSPRNIVSPGKSKGRPVHNTSSTMLSALMQQQQQQENERLKRIAQSKKRNTLYNNWLRSLSAVSPQASLVAALEVMATCKTTRAFVVSEEGDPLGVVTFRDICKTLIAQEDKLRSAVFYKITKLDKLRNKAFVENMNSLL